jgi:hypothetical protein
MGWQVHGTELDFDFRVDDHGLSVSGKGRQWYQSSLRIMIDMTGTKTLPAYWSVYRASEAASLARTLGHWRGNPAKAYLDEAVVKSTAKPIGIVSHWEQYPDAAYPRHIGFSAFLPDQNFENFWKLMKLCLSVPSMRYWLTFDFIGFTPHGIETDPDIIGYDEWLAGRPCVSEGIAFGVRTGEPQPIGSPQGADL